ncbi:MAG: 4'-phosphopantetheinyl transferase superfamily protein [Proteobacteria bacterium]|nr:4'-phosphopantetheinyl transferase superfamily protein [Pseudomonadota bacterium]
MPDRCQRRAADRRGRGGHATRRRCRCPGEAAFHAQRDRAVGPAWADRERVFLQGWTRKEACLKALGSGLSVPPGRLEAGCDESARRVVAELQVPPGRDRAGLDPPRRTRSEPLPGGCAAPGRFAFDLVDARGGGEQLLLDPFGHAHGARSDGRNHVERHPDRVPVDEPPGEQHRRSPQLVAQAGLHPADDLPEAAVHSPVREAEAAGIARVVPLGAFRRFRLRTGVAVGMVADRHQRFTHVAIRPRVATCASRWRSPP